MSAGLSEVAVLLLAAMVPVPLRAQQATMMDGRRVHRARPLVP